MIHGSGYHYGGREMKRLITTSSGLLLLIILVFASGCDNKEINGPRIDPSGIESIELRITHSQIRGFVGDIRSEQITAVARDINGVAVPGADIEFAIQNPQAWMGTISNDSPDALTDDEGQIRATYTIQIDRTTDVMIEARCGQITKQVKISVIVVDEVIGSLSMEASRRLLTVPPNQTRQTNVTATLVDVDGNALQGMQIKFRTSPSAYGFVDSDTATTDYNGRASRSFSSIVNKYGTCQVIAEVGEHVGSASIEIRAVEAPAFISMSTDKPEVRIAGNQNATIDIEAFVTDSNRIGVPGATVAFEVAPYMQGGSTFGSLSSSDSTDQDGRIKAVFNSLGGFGKLRIRARVLPVGIDAAGSGSDQNNGIGSGSLKGRPAKTATNEGELIAELTIEVKLITNDIGSLTIRAIPNFMNLPADSNGASNIRVQVRDRANIGIPSVSVNFNTSIGALSHITLTDSNGIATAVFNSNFESGIARITAYIPGTIYTAETEITIQQSSGATGTLTITSDKNFIYADNGFTTANITALLSDESGQALAGKQIVFTKTHGTVNSPVTTDSLGIARAVFRDVGVPSVDDLGNVVPAVVTARYDALGLRASTAITIMERNPVSNITLQSGAEQMTAGSSDTTTVRATCFLANGNFAEPGTVVRFETDHGRFTEEAVSVSGNYGVAETEYIAGNIVGMAELTAFVQNTDGDRVYSNTVNINLLPGSPSRVTVTASPDQLVTNDPDTYSTITAVVSDAVNNPVVQGTLVRFETSMGNITPSAITDMNGRATARLTAGVAAGLAEVKASVSTESGVIEGSTTVTFVAGGPNSIELSASPLNIAVAGTGGRTTSTLSATVLDANGNPVEETTTVMFQLLNEPAEPQGCNINNRGQIDSSLTSSGVAVVSLNSGIQSGGKLIRAFTWRDEARMDTVAVTLPTIAVVSGPPHQLDIDLNDEGVDALGGAWKVEVSARVFDIHRNPVADNIPVVFTIEPDIASITAGYTGNLSSSGTSEPGLAYADLVYQSAVTFSSVTISANVATPQGSISGSKTHILPLQGGEVDLHFDPANWLYSRARPDDLCNIQIWVVLKDGHQALINNAPVLFTVDKGRLWWYDHQSRQYETFYPLEARKITGVNDQHHSEESGQATVYLRGIMNEFFMDDFDTGQTVQVNASVEGYNEVAADPGYIFLNRR